MTEHFEGKLNELLLSKLGSTLVTKYLEIIKKQIDVTDFTACNEYEKRRILEFVVDKLYAKTLKKEDLKKQKYIIFYQFFGEKKAMEYLDSNQYTIQPVTFVYYVFGDALGEKIITIGKKLYNEYDIIKKDELQQVLFVKRLIIDVFSVFGENHVKELDMRFFMFLKFGEDPKNNVIKFLISQGKDQAAEIMRLFDHLFSFFGRAGGAEGLQMSDTDLKVTMNQMGINAEDQANWLQKIHSEMQTIQTRKMKAALASGGKHSIAEVQRVLSTMISFEDAQETVQKASEATGIKVFDKIDEKKKQLFYDYLLHNTAISTYSIQKLDVIKGKIYSVIFDSG